MKILDLTAGNRAVWFDRANPLVTFVDIRPEVAPDVVADSRALQAEVGSGFTLVVFDPPHKNNGANGNMTRNYGHWTHAEIRELIGGAAGEAWRVTVPDALMAFKWNDHGIKLDTVLALLAPWWVPLFGHGASHQQHASKTFWVMLRRLATLCRPGSQP